LALPVRSLVLPVVTLLPHIGKLLAQERNQGISGSVALLRWLLRACREQRREGSVKFRRIDAPATVLVAGGANLPGLDVPEHGAFVDAGGGGCSRKIIQGGCSLLLRGLPRGCTRMVKRSFARLWFERAGNVGQPRLWRALGAASWVRV
jgi:hypothetical protein